MCIILHSFKNNRVCSVCACRCVDVWREMGDITYGMER